MPKTLKQRWRKFTRGRPGSRFQERYRRKRAQGRHPVARYLSIVVGTLLFAVGLFLLPAPGPGILVVFAGAGLAAEGSLTVAKVLDAGELLARRVMRRGKAFWGRSSLAVRAGLAIGCLLVLAALGVFTWELLLSDAT